MKHRAVTAALSGIACALLGATALAQTPAPASGSLAALPAGSSAPATPSAVAAAADDGVIISTVNDEPITRHDLEARLKLFLAFAPGLRPTDEDMARYRRDLLKTLQSEMLRIQAARQNGITVSPREIEERVEQFAAANGTTKEEMEATLKRAGASLDTLRNTFKVERAWQDTIVQEFRDKVIPSVSDADVDAELRRIAERSTKPRYHVLEIFLAVDDPKNDARVKKEAEDIHEQIRQGAAFPGVARQFSQNPSAASGGDIGWVSDGELPEELNTVIASLKKGMLAQPVRGRGGYYILYLADRMEPYGTKIETVLTAGEAKTTELPLVRILLPLPPNPPKELATQAMGFAEQYRLNLPPCGADLKKDVEGRNGVYMELGTFNLADLVPEAQQVLARTRPGEVASPFLSEVGVELFARCDARQEVLTAFQMPTRDEVQNQLFENRITALARGFERDLRRNANVEER